MQLFEQKPVHVRKMIALGTIAVVAVVLILVLLYTYTRDTEVVREDRTASRISQFYATLLENTQSFIGEKRAILKK